MRSVDTDALRAVAPALGLGNPVTATEDVVLDDDVLQQSLDVSRLVRRGRSPGQSTGLFTVRALTSNTGGGTIDFDPYRNTSTAVPAFGDWPPVPFLAEHDVWLMGVSGALQAGLVADFVAAAIMVEYSAEVMGRTIPGPGSGPPLAQTVTRFPVAFYDDTLTLVTRIWLTLDPTSSVPRLLELPVRIRPGGFLRFDIAPSAGASIDVELQAILGLFPRGLGQDGAL